MKLLCCLLLLVSFASAQTAQTAPPAQTATAQSPAAAPAPTPAEIAQMQKTLQDWPNLNGYRTRNAALPPPAPGVNRVVFMGDSLTDLWGHVIGVFFPGKPYINRGISGQTTPQMLIRFRPDVIDLQPKVVVILGGTNDIAGNTGPSTPKMIEDNLMSMADLARANGIRVVLASILPATHFPWKPGIDPAEEIRTINQWIQDYCAQKGYTYLDYYSALVNDSYGMKKNLTIDGVHPNAAGYQVMTPLAEKAISEALEKK